jgi:hypothetical protein
MSKPGENDDGPAPNADGSSPARDRKNTPVISVGGPEGAANRIAQLGRTARRTVEMCERVERLVRSGGFDAAARGFLIELADHFDNISGWAAGTGRILRRLADLG